jgi:hypothetical protein
MKKLILFLIFLICLGIFSTIKFYDYFNHKIDLNSLKKVDSFSVWRAKDKKGKWHYIIEYCRIDDETAGDTKILRCKTFGYMENEKY